MSKQNKKIGVVDVGGGYRGIYAAGVLDTCMEQGVVFDVCIGVSAGSANMASYMAGQQGRNLRFHSEFGLRKEYSSMENFFKKSSYIDLDYIYGGLSNSDGEYPLDYRAFQMHPAQFVAVATNAYSGKARYFYKQHMKRDNFEVLKASSAIPFVCQPQQIGKALYYDGALSDPVPIRKAFEMGCDKVVLLLTLPESTVRTAGKDPLLAAAIKRKYPRAAEQLKKRHQLYNAGVALAKRYAEQGKLLIVAPEDTCGVKTLCRDREALLRLYEKGRQDGRKVPDFLI